MARLPDYSLKSRIWEFADGYTIRVEYQQIRHHYNHDDILYHVMLECSDETRGHSGFDDVRSAYEWAESVMTQKRLDADRKRREAKGLP